MKKQSIKSLALAGSAFAAVVVMGGLSAQAQSAPANESKTWATSQSPEKKVSAEQAKLQSQAKITMDQAREIALKKAPGEVRSSELEKEHGKIVYSFDIQQANEKKITEVQVSAIDGSIVSIKKESAANEAKETKQEEAEKKKAAAQSQKPPQP
jgi:uncharacterized membrane protein YkoI